MNNTLRILALAAAIAVLAGCKTRKVDDTPAPRAADPAPAAQPAPARGEDWTDVTLLDTKPCLKARTVNFDFDKSDISGQFDEMIGCHAKWLQNNPGARLTLEGNADERGTREYNLGLGERRGNAVRDLLQARGARAEQLTVVSYGEERPVCVESTEDCWARNRRADLVYTQRQ